MRRSTMSGSSAAIYLSPGPVPEAAAAVVAPEPSPLYMGVVSGVRARSSASFIVRKPTVLRKEK
jgi:hypothetical protein